MRVTGKSFFSVIGGKKATSENEGTEVIDKFESNS